MLPDTFHYKTPLPIAYNFVRLSLVACQVLLQDDILGTFHSKQLSQLRN